MTFWYLWQLILILEILFYELSCKLILKYRSSWFKNKIVFNWFVCRSNECLLFISIVIYHILNKLHHLIIKVIQNRKLLFLLNFLVWNLINRRFSIFIIKIFKSQCYDFTWSWQKWLVMFIKRESSNSSFQKAV